MAGAPILDLAVNTLVSASEPVYSSLSQSSAAGKSSPQFPALSNASLPPEPLDVRLGPGAAAGPPGAAAALAIPVIKQSSVKTVLPQIFFVKLKRFNNLVAI